MPAISFRSCSRSTRLPFEAGRTGPYVCTDEPPDRPTGWEGTAGSPPRGVEPTSLMAPQLLDHLAQVVGIAMEEPQLRMTPPDAAVLAHQDQGAAQLEEIEQDAIAMAHAALDVRGQWEGKVVLPGEGDMGFERIIVDREQLDPEIFETREVVAVVAQLSRADERVVLRVEDEQHGAVLQQRLEPHVAARRRQREIDRGIPHAGNCHTPPPRRRGCATP